MKSKASHMKSKASHYIRLQKVLTATFLVLIIIPTLIITWVTADSSRKAAIDQIEDSETQLTKHMKDVVSLYLLQKEEMLENIVRLFPREYLKEQANLNTIFSAMSRNGEIVDLHAIDSSGMQLSYVGPYRSSIIGKNYNNAPWFKEVLVSGKHISDIFEGYRNIPHIVVAVTDPLKTLVLRATINSEIFNSLLNNAQIGPNGDAFILNTASEFQTPSLQGINRLEPQEKTLLEHHDGTSIEIIHSYLYATTWLKDGQWLLVIKSRIEDSLVPYYRNRERNLIIIAVTSIVSLLAAVLISHFMVVRIERAERERGFLNQQMVQVEKMAAIGRLAAGIAHEINNPLQMITSQAGWINELLEDEDPNQLKNRDEYREAVKKIKSHVHRAGTVTHRLLGFSKKMDSQLQNVNMAELIEETISFVENEAKNNNIEIRRKLDPALPSTLTDGPRLQQVVLNILNNSMDALVQNGWIEISAGVEGKTLVIRLSDSGPGMTEEVLKHIFDPFYTTKSPGKGTGLGLSICYSIMQKLGGEILVSNRKEGGALFTLILPIDSAKQKETTTH